MTETPRTPETAAISEAIEAEWFNGNMAEDCRDRLLAALSGPSGPKE